MVTKAEIEAENERLRQQLADRVEQEMLSISPGGIQIIEPEERLTVGDVPDGAANPFENLRRVVITDLNRPEANYVLPIRVSSRAGRFSKDIITGQECLLPEAAIQSLVENTAILTTRRIRPGSQMYGDRILAEKTNPGFKYGEDDAGAFLVRSRRRFTIEDRGPAVEQLVVEA